MIPKLIKGPKGTDLIGLFSIKPFSEAQIRPVMEAYNRVLGTDWNPNQAPVAARSLKSPYPKASLPLRNL
tara:strand:+ start:304 stop:513 length:210 start_codon:yes stop_codon:yes gene_type:complete